MTLDAALLAAHANHDGTALAALYAQAADATDNEDAACFYLTQAYVYALETDDTLAATLYGRLKAKGRV